MRKKIKLKPKPIREIIHLKVEKAKRPDVAERIKNNKLFNFSCVKCKWKTFCKTKYLNEGINNIVLNINKISFLSYKLLNFHFVNLIEQNKPLPKINRTLFYKACCMVSKFYKRKNKIEENDELYISFSKLQKFIDKLPFRDNMGSLINNLTRQQLTATKNHLKLNFYNRFRKYVKLETGIDNNSTIYKILKSIYDKDYNGDDEFIKSMKQWLKFIPTEINIEKNMSHFLTIYYQILKTFESKHESVDSDSSNEEIKGIRLFNLLPNKNNFTLSHITICNSSLNDIISFLTSNKRDKNFMNKKREYWTKLFNVGKYETKNRKFAYSISTNGNDVSIWLQKRKKEVIEDDNFNEIDLYKNNQYEQFVGIDPGIRSLYTSSNSIEENKHLHITTREYRHLSKMKYNCKKRERWYKKWGNDEYTYWQNIPSYKTTSSDLMIKYCKYVFSKLDKLFNFHIKKNFRGLKFNAYCRSKSTLTKICKRIVNNKKTLIGFGDFSQQHGLVKKHPTTPILKLRKELKKYGDVVLIDEYRTSKTCYKCKSEIKLYRNKQIRKDRKTKELKKARMSDVHSVIRCINNECSLYCMDRDVNASKNMLYLLQLLYRGEERQACFKPAKTTVRR